MHVQMPVPWAPGYGHLHSNSANIQLASYVVNHGSLGINLVDKSPCTCSTTLGSYLGLDRAWQWYRRITTRWSLSVRNALIHCRTSQSFKSKRRWETESNAKEKGPITFTLAFTNACTWFLNVHVIIVHITRLVARVVAHWFLINVNIC